eukprot:1378371-Amorphochlora_amoeboformis.AAC.1
MAGTILGDILPWHIRWIYFGAKWRQKGVEREGEEGEREKARGVGRENADTGRRERGEPGRQRESVQ